MRLLISVVLIMATLAAYSDDAFRDDFADTAGWTARPDWLSPPSDNPSLQAVDGVGRFGVPEPSRGMKWLRQLDEPLDLEMCPWLVIRYRTENYDPARPDYVLWLKDRAQREGVKLLTGDRLRADGEWHTLAVNLPDAGVVSPVTQIALQCFATEAGNGALWVDYLAITDLPPTDAEGYAAPTGAGQEWPVDLSDPKHWTVQPGWLGTYTPRNQADAGKPGVIFRIGEGMLGAKWSYALEEPISGAQWVAMRYRARDTSTFGEYALYVASEGGGAAPQEQFALTQSELYADGAWHVAVGRVTVPTIRTLAIQAQAARDNAFLEVADLRFLDRKPVIKLADTFDGAPGWPRNMAGWRVVTLPPGNLSGLDLGRRLGAEGWIPEGRIASAGVPFEVRSGADAAIVTPLRQPGEIAVPLTGKSAEAYLLLAAQFPRIDEPSYAGSSGVVKHVNRLVARIEYADGAREEQFPFSLTARRHAVSRWLGTYALALDPKKPLKRLTLVDSMKLGTFGLVGLTLSDKPGPATAATRLRPTPPQAAEKPVAARAAGITRRGNILAVDAWSISLALDLSKGLRLRNLVNHAGVGLQTKAAPGPLFRVIGEGFEVTSEQFVVADVSSDPDTPGARPGTPDTPVGPGRSEAVPDKSVGRTSSPTRLTLRCDQVSPAITVTVRVDVEDPREIGLQAAIALNGHDPAKTRLIFPEVGGLTFGGKPEGVWVWCPRRGDIITDAAVNLREPYAGAGNPFQIVGAFDPVRGAGLYLMTQDMEGLSKFYHAQKTATGGRVAVEYEPLHDASLPRTVLGCTQGDWHPQMARYQEWLRTWYQPAAPRKNWFRRIWSFRQQFMHFELPSKSGMFDPATKALKVKEVLDADAEAFGGLDYLHLFDWGWDPVHGRCGDYEPWDYLGGADSFRRAVEEVKAAGTPVGLYIEGILVDQESNLGKAHGAQWQMLGPGGKPYQYFAPSYHVCPRVPQWQDYLSDTYRRVRDETGAVGFYIDEYGFSGPSYWCYNPDHGHPVPVTPVVGELGMLRKVREKLGPEAAIYTEESPTDVNSQYQDGSFTYNISSAPDEWSPSHVNLYRFVIPDHKTIEIICCDQPLGTNVEAVKRCLFNGEAIWIEGIRDKWFAPETRAQIALNRRVMRENQQCFTSEHVQPLVPTLLSGLYANQFGERRDLLGKTCWTIYNTNYRTVRAEVIAVDHAPGAQYLDEMTGRPLQPRIVGKRAYLTMEIAPRDVVVVSRGLYVR